ncbi:olfactory receptor-like protein OLF4 [Bufo gargarizans]|uniref:olfactory receptor-like protein OLF4 n=1 Tax=Bufo gargarizans TaxID=30331 RepID=UPI001CF22A73|nr:olfactory receptor-like protein OLF4 [Bufo gargarizans]XP_044132833.1 olfactory receptor-like protein OLF4 [Bufo gargarizans]
MMNMSITKEFQIVAFSSDGMRQPFLFVFFFAVYLIGILGNLLIFVVIVADRHLHTPMYVFLCNLSSVDISYMNITLPKLMYILLSGDNSISFIQCFTQLYFYNFIVGTEIILLSVMAYDRYVAICKPLHYHLIMKRKNIILLLCTNWLSGCLNSLLLICLASRLSFCRSLKIHHFYCDAKALVKISCPSNSFKVILNLESLLFGPVPFMIGLLSYIQIIRAIMQIKSTNSRRKAFSTCTSHLTVLSIFYGTVICTYMTPVSENSEIFDQIFSVLYTAVTPMLNPLIYSLRNKDVKNAIYLLLSHK